MSALRRDLRDLEARRPAADHDDLAGDVRLPDQPLIDLELAAGSGIVNAADALFLAHLMDAAVVASDAGSDEIGAPHRQLVRGVRVRDELPRPANEIGMTGLQHRLGATRRGDAAKGDDREFRRRFQRPV